MTNPLVTTEEVRQADLIAVVEDAEYRAVSVVYRLNGKGDAAFYCSLSDWPKTEAGRVARYVEEIERLQAENEELRASLLLQGSRPVTVEEALHIKAGALICPHCGAGPFQRAQGRAAHIRIKHKNAARTRKENL